MFGKIVILLVAITSAVLALPAEYPAGIHPAVCPNYPFCEPGITSKFTWDGMPIPEWGVPSVYYNPAALAPALPAARYPADVNPAECPNYPYCS